MLKNRENATPAPTAALSQNPAGNRGALAIGATVPGIVSACHMIRLRQSMIAIAVSRVMVMRAAVTVSVINEKRKAAILLESPAFRYVGLESDAA